MKKRIFALVLIVMTVIGGVASAQVKEFCPLKNSNHCGQFRIPGDEGKVVAPIRMDCVGPRAQNCDGNL